MYGVRIRFVKYRLMLGNGQVEDAKYGFRFGTGENRIGQTNIKVGLQSIE